MPAIPITWFDKTGAASMASFYQATYSPLLSMWMWACKKDTTSGRGLIRSSDAGGTWIDTAVVFGSGSPNDSQCYEVLWGGGIFVAAGRTPAGAATNVTVYTSTNGTSWFGRATGTLRITDSLIYNPTSGAYWIGGRDSSGNRTLMFSSSGSSWSAFSAPFVSANPGHVCFAFSPTLGIYVAAFDGSGSGSGCIYTTTDLSTWTQRVTPFESGHGGQPTITRCRWIDSLGMFFVSGNDADGNKVGMRSSNGTSWTALSTPVDSAGNFATGNDFIDCASFVAFAVKPFGNGPPTWLYSTNGTSWSSLSNLLDSPSGGQGVSGGYSPGLDQLILTGNNGGSTVAAEMSGAEAPGPIMRNVIKLVT